MGKLNLVAKEIPKATRESKNAEAYKEINDAFQLLEKGQCIEVPNSDLSAATLVASAREIITVKAGEYLRVSKLTGEDGKVTGVRLSKVAATEKKPQGETTTFTANN